MKIEFIPLDYEYYTSDNKTFMRIYGRTSENKTCCIIDETINFFYILDLHDNSIQKYLEKIKKIPNVKKAELINKNYLEKPVKAIKIYCEYNKMQDIAHAVEALNPFLESRERDINQITRYIIEKGIKPLVWYEIQANALQDRSIKADFVLKLEKAKELPAQAEEAKQDFKPKVLAFDIESEEFEIGRGRIYMISLVSEKFRKVLTWKKTKTSQDFVEFVKDEKEMLEKFQDYINELQPDIITGYFSDSFDLPYIRARADKYKIELKFGIADSKIVFSKGKLTNSKITGLSHVDLLKVIETYYSQYLQSETLGLDDVAKELLGDGKKDIDHNNVHNFKEKEWKEFFEYNLHDSILTYNLFQKLWQDMLEFTRIVKEPLAVITRQGMSGLVESYIIHNLERFNEIAEKRPIHEEIQQRRLRQKYEGAFVLQPEADLYENLAIFDFTSYWPSIIVSFNLTYSTFLKHKPEKQANALEVDLGKQGKVYFSKTKGVFPKLLEEIIRLRKKYKQELKEKPDAVKKARSNAFKLLANASYGYQGFFGARYYCPEASAATTAISRGFTKKIIDTMNKNGFKVIYSDTDSIAFLLQDKTKKQTFEFLKKLNDELPGIMELELEDFFTRGIWVTKRTGEFGAKKKYALINEQGKLKIRGFETVRRDWCKLAREVQNKVLELILKEGKYENALKYVQETIKKLKTRKISKDKLIIRTQLKKPIQDYKAETPHVTIAKKMHERGIPADVGMLIQYYVADTGKSKDRVRDKARLPDEKGEYDIEYYTKNQIFPAIENIFDIFKIKEKEILESEQKKIESFFN